MANPIDSLQHCFLKGRMGVREPISADREEEVMSPQSDGDMCLMKVFLSSYVIIMHELDFSLSIHM